MTEMPCSVDIAEDNFQSIWVPREQQRRLHNSTFEHQLGLECRVETEVNVGEKPGKRSPVLPMTSA